MRSTEELKKLTLSEVEAELSNAVYAASKLIEDLEHADLVQGNGHHARQCVAAFAVAELRARWRGMTPTTLEDSYADFTRMTAQEPLRLLRHGIRP